MRIITIITVIFINTTYQNLIASDKIFFERSYEIFFNNDSSNITPESLQILTHISRLINEKLLSIQNIEINGHTNTIGTTNNNKILSKKRALSVKNFFTDSLDSIDIKILCHYNGESRLKHLHEKSLDDFSENRRVTIKLIEALKY
jgi:outer membrane protein OmpA-like peptidoglycan-associated protein